MTVKFDSLPDFLRAFSQEEFYRELDYSYFDASNCAELEQSDGYARLLSMICWKSKPDRNAVKQFFNQVNSFYGELFIFRPKIHPSIENLCGLNQIILHRQGKWIGLRSKEIAFGYRRYLDIFDPRRATKWIYGIEAQFLSDVLSQWVELVLKLQKTHENAILLSIILIGVHPFSDGNGRIGRIAFTWICRSWKLKEMWLEEDEDGELLRTGAGIHSTEYIMADFLIYFSEGFNVVDPTSGGRGKNQYAVEMSNVFQSKMAAIRKGDSTVERSEQFRQLIEHFHSHNHLTLKSPRFRCLQNIIE